MLDFLNNTTPFDTTGTNSDSTIFDVLSGNVPVRGEVNVKVPTATILITAGAVLIVGVILIRVIYKSKK